MKPGHIGMTPLLPARALSDRLGAGHLFLKWEGTNPTGVHKDRAARAMVDEALRGGWREITVGTCGNLGASLVQCAASTEMSLTIFIPERYHAPRIQALSLPHRIVRTPGGYEEAVQASRQHARACGAYDANPSGAGGPVSLLSYEAIALEILAGLAAPPESVWVPAGNGTTVAGIGRGFLRACPGMSPRICAAGSAGNTAATASVQAGTVVDLDPAALRETPVNEPLLNWKSLHAAEVLAVVTATGGLALDVTDGELLCMADALLELERVAAAPSACAGLAGLAAALATGRLAPGTHVAVLTARA